MARSKKSTTKAAQRVKTAAKRARKKGQSLARKPAAKKAVGRAKKAVTGARQKAKALGTKIAGNVTGRTKKWKKAKVLAAAGTAAVTAAAGIAVARTRKKKRRWLG
jgi:hypothetical protein